MRAINPPDPSIPGISQAMLVPPGNLLFLSGHVPFGPEGIVGTDVPSQLEQVFKNLQATLREAGAGFEHVARLTLFIRDYDASMLPAIRAVRDRYVNPANPPASALVGVASLFLPDVLVEVDAIAALPT